MKMVECPKGSLCPSLKQSRAIHLRLKDGDFLARFCNQAPAGPLEQARLPDIQHWYFRDCPALIRAGHLELYHRDRICGTSNDTEATTDTLLLVDDHIGAAAPGLCTGVHRVALDDARKAFHADAVVRTDVHAAGTEDTD